MNRKMQDFITTDKDIFIGLEDSLKKWKLCCRSNNGIVHETSMPADYQVLFAFLKKFKNCRIKVMYEAGFKGFNLYDRLTEDNIECVVLPPHLLLEEKHSKVKTDKHDARKLARMLESGDYPGCSVPDRERREDRQICRTLNAVEKDIKSTRNRIRKLLQFHGVETGITKNTWQKGEFRSLKELALSDSLKKAIYVLLSQLDTLWEYQTELRKELKALAEKERYHKAFLIVKSAPGIGWLTAIRLVLELGEDFSRFASGRNIASFVGLTGSECSTGERVCRGRITGQGNAFVRSWLIESAWVCIRLDPAMQEFFQRIYRNSGSKKKAIVAVARKMVVRLRACAIGNVPYQIGVVE